MNLIREKQRVAGQHPCCADAPDTSKQQEAALMTANLSKEQLDWAKQIYEETAPDRSAAASRARDVSDLQMQGMRKQIALSDDITAFNNRTLRPLQESIVKDANEFDTEGKREELAGLALGDVNQSFASARDQAERAQARSGINPNDGKSLAFAPALASQQALASTGARNSARMNAITLGDAKKKDAAAVLSGLPGTQSTAASLAITGGNSAAGNAAAALQPGQQAQALLNQGYSGARAGYGQAANIYGNIAQQEAGADAAGNSNAAALGGTIATVGIAI